MRCSVGPGRREQYVNARMRAGAEATMPALREHLADVALQYEKLAEDAEAGYHDPE